MSKWGQIQKIDNIEIFKGFKCVKYAYISNTNGFAPETIVILSSHMHISPIYALQGAHMRLGVGSEATKGVKIRKY